MANEKRVRSFSATEKVDSILDDVSWGQRSKLICNAIENYCDDDKKNTAADEGAKTTGGKETQTDGSEGTTENKGTQETRKHASSELSLLLGKFSGKTERT